MKTFSFTLLAVLTLIAICFALHIKAEQTRKASHRSMSIAGYRPFSLWETIAAPFIQALQGLSSWTHRVLCPNRIALANENLTVTRHCESGTYLADNAISENRILKQGTTDKHVDHCGAADVPFAWSQDSVAAAAPIGCEILGLTRKSIVGVASEAIATRTRVFPAAAGKLQDLPVAAGTYYCVGISAQSASGDDDKFEVIPCAPYPVVVA